MKLLKCPYCGCKALDAGALTLCCGNAIRKTMGLPIKKYRKPKKSQT